MPTARGTPKKPTPPPPVKEPPFPVLPVHLTGTLTINHKYDTQPLEALIMALTEKVDALDTNVTNIGQDVAEIKELFANVTGPLQEQIDALKQENADKDAVIAGLESVQEEAAAAESRLDDLNAKLTQSDADLDTVTGKSNS